MQQNKVNSIIREIAAPKKGGLPRRTQSTILKAGRVHFAAKGGFFNLQDTQCKEAETKLLDALEKEEKKVLPIDII